MLRQRGFPLLHCDLAGVVHNDGVAVHHGLGSFEGVGFKNDEAAAVIGERALGVDVSDVDMVLEIAFVSFQYFGILCWVDGFHDDRKKWHMLQLLLTTVYEGIEGKHIHKNNKNRIGSYKKMGGCCSKETGKIRLRMFA